MDTPLLTIGEATQKTGLSASTIRRLIRSITDSASHPDRKAIEPTTQQVETLKKKGENFTWKIREDILERHLKTAQKEERKSASSARGGTSPEVLQILRSELDLKNQQIEKQWEVIHALNDRLREGNILMGSLQQRLALPTAEAQKATDTVPIKEASAKAAKKSPAPPVAEGSAKPVTEVSAKPSKKFWDKVFGW